MKKKSPETNDLARLRWKAEAQLTPAADAGTTALADSELLHELRVHQLELEMQNETLRQSQIALEESRDRYIDFYDFAPVGYLTLNEQGLIAELNLAAAEMLGTTRDKLLRSRFAASVAVEERDQWRHYFVVAMRQDTRLNCELALLRANGARVEVLVDTLRLCKEGKAPELRVVLTDVTERKRTDQALKISQQRFHDIVSTTDGIVWEADARTFDFSFVSPQAERLLGYPAQDWLQPGFWVAHLHPDDKGWAPKFCADHAQRLQPHDFEYRFVARDGRTVWLHDIVTVVAEDGAPRWLRGIMVDVSRQKQAEQELRDMAGNLEAKVQERTRELRALAAQLTMTEERERRLLAQDLHDNLGQLLAVIRIKLSSLAAGPDAAPVKEIADLVIRAEQSARSVSLELSPPILRTLGLMPALEWLTDELARVYGIAVQLDGDICERQLGDEIQAVLYRSVRELLINVARHAGVREANVACLCDGGRLIFVVGDDGCGFNAAGFPDAVPDRHTFGLRSIYERIRNLGGEMDIDSSPGNGTTVTLAVPCAVVEKEASDDPHCSGR